MVEFPCEGVVDYSDAGNEVVHEGQRDADVGVCVNKIRGSIDGVAHEGGCRSKVKAWMIAFFSKKPKGV